MVANKLVLFLICTHLQRVKRWEMACQSSWKRGLEPVNLTTTCLRGNPASAHVAPTPPGQSDRCKLHKKVQYCTLHEWEVALIYLKRVHVRHPSVLVLRAVRGDGCVID